MLQRVFLDHGVVSRTKAAKREDGDCIDGKGDELESTEPIIIGSLRKSCYASFTTYVRGALAKLATDTGRGVAVNEKMGGITDEEIDDYEKRYRPLRKELSVTWSLMAFSAGVVESLIVVDRWMFLREHADVVRDCWVEPVFEYAKSPRNLVVVGIKR